MTLTPEHLAALKEVASRATPGRWQAFICDDGGQWSGWPLSVSSVDDPEHTVVRPGGFYPYEWDHKTSQYEAVANAEHIAAFNPTTCLKLLEEVERLREDLRILTQGRFVQS
jgi:hypothetical protein